MVEAQRKTRMITCYKLADPEATVSFNLFLCNRKTTKLTSLILFLFQNALSTKAMVAKLSGFAKFDLDLKLTCEQFQTLVANYC